MLIIQTGLCITSVSCCACNIVRHVWRFNWEKFLKNMIFKHDRIRGLSTYCCAVGFNTRVQKVFQPEVAVDAETSVSWLYSKVPFIACSYSKHLVLGKHGFPHRWAVFDVR